MGELREAIAGAVQELFSAKVEVALERPEEQFGDYSTNIAMQLAGQLKQSPKELADKLATEIGKLDFVEKAEVAGPGFINITLTDQALLASLDNKPAKPLKGQTVVAEYSDPNPFKVLHVGHLYTSVVGDAISNLLENAGAKVYRVNFGGDVGLHVAKAMWGIKAKLGSWDYKAIRSMPEDGFVEWLGEQYILGSFAYGEEEKEWGKAPEEIKEINLQIYKILKDNDQNSPIAKVYWEARKRCYGYFEKFYAKIGTHFDKYYPESVCVEPGLKAVKENMGKVFEESDGAVVFKGETHNLHTRVFINSDGLPTYETKDIGLLLNKWRDYHFDRSVVITGNEIYEYMQVVLKAVEQFEPELVKKTAHITHGMVKMAGAKKMSSRKGDVIRAEDVIDVAQTAAKQLASSNNFEIALGAIKYSFLKSRIGADIIFDPAESVSLEGNSGPYLQYAHARASSILAKAKKDSRLETRDSRLEQAERSLTRKLGQYAETVENAANELLPSHICTYLYELTQAFNRFYESSRVIDDPRQAIRLKLVGKYAETLNSGLNLLGIAAPEKL